ncbi:hypothetical protein [Thermomonospora umbrina]|uniref:hypothetical protein n=1 Tax=Thermomonospora umbrina TaxID=111806 RepID=UPI000E21C295|nr:hypothetical protein [Thermomonospora umbrina]
MASEALHKVGRTHTAEIAADRATTYADRSGDPTAQAMAARSLGVVLRHQGRPLLAEQITSAAAVRLERSGLTTARAANAFAQILCSSAGGGEGIGGRETFGRRLGDDLAGSGAPGRVRAGLRGSSC